MGIRFEKAISEEKAALICEWSNKKGKNFQEKWMGFKVSVDLHQNSRTEKHFFNLS